MRTTTDAELEALERLQNNVETIDEFVARVTPRYAVIPWHLRQVYNLFELSRHQEVYATIAMPPRHGKTTSIALGLAWRTLYDPACLNFYATYGKNLSTSTSRKVRKLSRLAGVPLSREVKNMNEWETPWGGGLKATSLGGDVTGRGCNGGIVVGDDIIKGRKQAESKLVRDEAWDWLRDDLMSRLEPGASLFVNATRWHEDDPIGRLHEDPLGLPWIHIELPAVRDSAGLAADERETQDVRALWSGGGYDLERLARIRMRSEHGWWSLYQQKPYPRGGGMFKIAQVKFLDEAPAGGRCVRKWDLAASSERDSAWTVGTRMQLVDTRVVVQDVRRGQWLPHEVDEQILRTANQDGHSIPIWLPQDPGQAGKAQKAHLAKKLEGFEVHFERESGSKDLRAEPVAAQVGAGNFFVVRAPWNAALLDEMETFPRGRTKDQVDTLSGAYSALLSKPATRTFAGGVGVIGERA